MDLLESMQQYAYDRGIEVDDFSVGGQTAIALKYNDDAYIAIDYNHFNTRAEQSVALAHEIGHIETDSLVSIYEPYYPASKREYRASKWAVLELVPKDMLHNSIKDNQGRLDDIAECFGVTIEFIKFAIEYYKRQNEHFIADLLIDN